MGWEQLRSFDQTDELPRAPHLVTWLIDVLQRLNLGIGPPDPFPGYAHTPATGTGYGYGDKPARDKDQGEWGVGKRY
jgi:hypothetical protein